MMETRKGEQIDPLFLATVQAVEESIINALIAAQPMTGYQGHKVAAIDHQALIKLLKEHKATDTQARPR